MNYNDPFNNLTYEQMRAYADSMNRLGYAPENLYALDNDWLAREGFDPRTAYKVPSVSRTDAVPRSAVGYYSPYGKDVRLDPYVNNAPGSITLAQDAPFEALLHESRHRALNTQGYSNLAPIADEGVVRMYDTQYGTPQMKQWAGNYLQNPKVSREAFPRVTNDMEARKQSAQAQQVLRGPMSPTHLIGYMMQHPPTPSYQIPKGPQQYQFKQQVGPIPQTPKHDSLGFKEADAARRQYGNNPAAARDEMVKSGQMSVRTDPGGIKWYSSK